MSQQEFSVAYLVSNSGVISLYLQGKPYSVSKEHPNYDSIREALKSKDYSKLAKLVDIPAAVQSKVTSKSGVEVKEGQVYFRGEVVHNVVVDKILQFVQEDFDFAPMVKFLANLMDNPSKKSVDNLYRFMEHNTLPVTEDGCLLAYKKVRQDYRDYHSGKFDNSVGAVCKMPRNKVEDDPSVACHNGLHVGSLDYASNQYYQREGKVVCVKVNPRDVVSVPTDYNSAKCRVCEYTVLADCMGEVTQADLARPDNQTCDDAENQCSECGDDVQDCTCDDDYCQDCGNHLDDCECDVCPNCDEMLEDCTCEDNHEASETY